MIVATYQIESLARRIRTLRHARKTAQTLGQTQNAAHLTRQIRALQLRLDELALQLELAQIS